MNATTAKTVTVAMLPIARTKNLLLIANKLRMKVTKIRANNTTYCVSFNDMIFFPYVLCANKVIKVFFV